MPKSATKAAKSKSAPKRAAKTKKRAAGRYDSIRVDLQRQRRELLNEAGEALTNRQEIEAFPDLSGGDPKVGQEQVVWHWLANANDVNFADVEQITLTPAPRRT